MALLRATLAARAAAVPVAQIVSGCAISTFALARSRSADVLDLLWGADGSNPKNPEGHVAQHHPLNADAAGPSAQRHGNHPDAAASTRQAVQRCATRMSISVAPGTPTTFAGALQPSSQARVITEAVPPFRVVHVNRSWEALCGWRASEVEGETMAVLQGPDTDPSVLAQIKEAALSCIRANFICINYRKDGSPFMNKLQISPLYDNSGAVSHLLGVLCPATGADAWRLAYERAGRAALEGGGADGGARAALHGGGAGGGQGAEPAGTAHAGAAHA